VTGGCAAAIICRVTRHLSAAAAVALLAGGAAEAQDSIAARLPATIVPAWSKGIQAINQENYWNAVACGKQGGQRPLCLFYEADLCPNGDFELAMFTPYKKVAYEVWQAVRAKQPPPTPSYAEAQRTRITIKLTPKAAARNPLKAMDVKRGDAVLKPVSQFFDAGVGNFTYDFPAFAATGDIVLEMIGRARTVSCAISQPVLAQMR
jgi:hypothetical protein